jgi:ribosome-binding protein aMBF1 (putative translation factor)
MEQKATAIVSPLGDDPRVSVNRRRQNPRYAALSILHRTRKNLTQKQLAERMKTSVSAISRLESGSRNPTLETLGKLAEALDFHEEKAGVCQSPGGVAVQ